MFRCKTARLSSAETQEHFSDLDQIYQDLERISPDMEQIEDRDSDEIYVDSDKINPDSEQFLPESEEFYSDSQQLPSQTSNWSTKSENAPAVTKLKSDKKKEDILKLDAVFQVLGKPIPNTLLAAVDPNVCKHIFNKFVTILLQY